MLHVLSLGAGVQSTTLALMAAHGEITPMPDCAIFADTQSEPRAVYEHLAWLCSDGVLPFPVHIVTAGSLGARLRSLDHRTDGRPPLFVRNSDGTRGMLRRQCTQDYKIIPIERKIRGMLDLRRGQRWPKDPVVEQWIGISRDEIERIKPSDRIAIVRRYPLVDLGMRRYDCVTWLQRHDYRVPGKSACVFCPYHDDDRWRHMRANDPAAWTEAVEIDAIIRRLQTLTGETYLHRSMRPLDEVDLSVDDRQADLFGNECEGMCGV